MLEQLLLTVLAMLALGMAVLLAVTWRLLRWLRRSPRLTP